MAASKKDNVNAGRVEYLGDDREGKLAALNNAVAAIEKNYGKGSIMKLGDSGANIDIEAIPTGSISLDGIRCWWCSKRTNHRNLWTRIQW